jgi:SAM-dependent methyltransferase
MERLDIVRGSTPTDGIYLEHYYRYRFAAAFVTHRTVLDCACGSGYGTFMLAQTATAVDGVDCSREALEIARANWSRENIRYHYLDAHDLHRLDSKFDAVVSFETIEHLKHPETFLTAVGACLNPNGIFVVSTPDKELYRSGMEPNRFHTREFSGDEFTRLLSDRFKNVRLFGQLDARNETAAAIAGPNGSRPALKSRMVEAAVHHPVVYAAYLYRMKRRFSVVPAQPGRHIYLVAVCEKG